MGKKNGKSKSKNKDKTKVKITMAKATPAMAVSVMAALRAGAAEAEAAGDLAKAAGLRREVITWKWAVAEKARASGRAPSQFGPGAVQLFERTGTLPDDTQVRGV